MSPRGRPRPLAPEKAMAYALWLLDKRPYTQEELRRLMRRRSLPEADCDRVLERLRELQLVDDRAFAANYLRGRAQERGRFALQQELRRKGVAEAVVRKAMEGDGAAPAIDEAQQRAAARALLSKHAWRFRKGAGSAGRSVGEGADDGRGAQSFGVGAEEVDARQAWMARQKLRAKAGAFLARRGFAPDAVADALDSAFGEEGQAEEG